MAVLLDSEGPYRCLCLTYGTDRLGLVLGLMEGLLSHWYLVRKLVHLNVRCNFGLVEAPKECIVTPYSTFMVREVKISQYLLND